MSKSCCGVSTGAVGHPSEPFSIPVPQIRKEIDLDWSGPRETHRTIQHGQERRILLDAAHCLMELLVLVLIILFGSLLLYRILGAFGIPFFATWMDSARFALATMFASTAISHFAPVKKDLIAMVPPRLPHPALIVFVTGIMELAGAVGLLIEKTRLWAALGLVLLLVAMFPANASAARRGIRIRGRPVSPIWIRAPMQILFILWAWYVK